MSDLQIPLNHGGRRDVTDRLIVHAMGEYVRGGDGIIRSAIDHLRNGIPNESLSAHALVLPDGRLISCVPLELKAWHAAAGGHNNRAVGIEVLCPGVHDLASLHAAIAHSRWFSPQQWNTTAVWAVAAIERFGELEILGHAQVDQQKQDPGAGFDLDAFRQDVAERVRA